MNLNFIWEALIVLLVGFGLIRASGKKTVGEMTGLEVITLLAIASIIGRAVSGHGLWKTVAILCIIFALLITIQFATMKYDLFEKLLLGKATLVIQDGQIIAANLKKLRMSVNQLEANLRAKGISSLADVKTATIEMNGQMGYEWMNHAKPVTVRELELMLAQQEQNQPPQQRQKQNGNLFSEITHFKH